MTPRFRALRALLPAATAALALAAAGCGTVTADGPGAAADRSAGTEQAPDRAELEARAGALQTVVDHVWVTEAPGYALAPQSVGVRGDDGFGSVYTAPGAGNIELSVQRAAHARAACADAPSGAPETAGTCEPDGGQWYRTSGSGHAYARAEGGLVVTVSAPRPDVDRATLRAAALAARPADAGELDRVLPPAGQAPGQAPVGRGDLPPQGDGAPVDGVGASG